ncbi:MAG: helix-turn-helix transcriptional regulator [Alphaproteobacteria bacterium]|nr:helix-turn-helix transcriptional regulator [Alphaproteobacteria bacterium]
MTARRSKLSLATETTYAAVVGRVLVLLRRERRIRQSELAGAAGVGQSTWSRIEAGASALTVDQLGRVAKALGLDAGDILAKADESVAGLEAEGIKVRRERSRGAHLALALIGAAALGLLVARILRK